MHHTDHPEDPNLLARIAVIAEIVLILIGGLLLSRGFGALLNLPTRADRDAILYNAAGPDWIAAANIEAITLASRYGISFAIIIALALFIGGPSRRLAGLSFGDRNFFSLIGFGVVMGFLLSAFAHFGHLAKEFFDLGENTPFWTLMGEVPWTPEFWIFTAVSSFIAVAILEELLIRGYALGRLRMHFSAGGAIIISALIFWIAHGQYLKLDPLLLYNSILVFVMALVTAWSVVRTGSLIPAIIAHGIGNVPLSTPMTFASLGVSLFLLLIFRRNIGAALSAFFSALGSTREWLFLIALIPATVGIAFAIRGNPQYLPFFVAGFAALALAGVIRRAPQFRRRASN